MRKVITLPAGTFFPVRYYRLCGRDRREDMAARRAVAAGRANRTAAPAMAGGLGAIWGPVNPIGASMAAAIAALIITMAKAATMVWAVTMVTAAIPSWERQLPPWQREFLQRFGSAAAVPRVLGPGLSPLLFILSLLLPVRICTRCGRRAASAFRARPGPGQLLVRLRESPRLLPLRQIVPRRLDERCARDRAPRQSMRALPDPDVYRQCGTPAALPVSECP